MAAALIAGLHDPSQSSVMHQHKEALRLQDKMQFDPMPSTEDILWSGELQKQPCHSKNNWRSTFVVITADNLFLAKDATSETCLDRIPLHQVTAITEHEASGERTSALVGSLERPATLEITILRAKDLIAADRGGTSDPYVSIHIGEKGKPVAKTHAMKRTLNPEWDQRFEIQLGIAQRRETLILNCKDYDAIGTDDPLGHVEIGLHDLIPGKEYAGWHSLHQEGIEEGKAGALEIRFKLEEEALQKEATYYFFELATVAGKSARAFSANRRRRHIHKREGRRERGKET